MKFIKPKKSLGQNFLKSSLALRKIIEAGEIKKGDVILEIGPGKGKLTEKLLEKSGKVIAIEKDRELYLYLQDKFKNEIASRSLVLVREDILKFDLRKVILGFSNGLGIVSEDLKKTSKSLEYKIIANIPYNITGAILKKFLTEAIQPEKMILMVQKEVAKRIVAHEGGESILSISVKAYGTPSMIMKVPSRYFSPAPKVDSAVIAIKDISRRNFVENEVNEEKFWEIVKLGFAHKRKKLSSNLKSLKYIEKNLLENLENKRAEELSLDEWINLTKASSKS